MARARTLLFNLQDKDNYTLRLKLMAGSYEALQVVRMPVKELANDELRAERERLEKDNLEARRTDWQQEQAKAKGTDGFFTCHKCGSKKTHFI